MRLQYQEIFETTKSIISIYSNLSYLEKHLKKDSNKYEFYLQFLSNMRRLEKEQYLMFLGHSGEQEYCTMLLNHSKDKYFLSPTKQALSVIRFSNCLGDNFYYMLDGVIKREFYSFQLQLDTGFLKNLSTCNTVSTIERNHLVDFMYGLLSSSPDLEEVWLNGEDRSIINLTSFQAYVHKKLDVLLNYLFSIGDMRICEETLAIILYAKTCLEYLDAEQLKLVSSELKKALEYNCEYGIECGESRLEISNMMSRLIDLGIQKSKQYNG